MTAIEARVEPAHVDAAVEAYVLGAAIQVCCPVARVLQQQVDRVAVVYQGAWHLGAQDKIPATRGEPLPPEAIAFIAKFDTWAKAVRSRVRAEQDLATAMAEAPGRPGGVRFTVELPTRPMVEASA